MNGRSRFLRYALVGTLAFAIDLGVTLLLLPVAPHYLIANTIGFAVANLVQFVIVHHWVFARADRTPLLRAYLKTLGISLAGLGLSNWLVYVGVDVAGVHIVFAKAITAVLVLVFNYALRVTMVYRTRPE